MMLHGVVCAVCQVPRLWWEPVLCCKSLSSRTSCRGGTGEMNDASEVLRKLYESVEQCNLRDLIKQCFGSEVCPPSTIHKPEWVSCATNAPSPACCLKGGLAAYSLSFLIGKRERRLKCILTCVWAHCALPTVIASPFRICTDMCVWRVD